MMNDRVFKLTRLRAFRFLAVAALCSLPAMWAVAASEQFNYANGPLEGAGSAGAWSGPWQAGPATDPGLGTSPFQVESGQLKIDFTDTPIFTYKDSDVERSLTTPIATNSVYMSFEITPGEMGSVVPNSFDDGYAGLHIGFADNATSIGTNGPMFSIFEYYNNFEQISYLQFDTSLDGIYDNTTAVVGNWTPGDTYRLVGRLDFDAVGLDEQWTVWLDPADETSTPQVVTQRDLGYDSIGITQMWQYIYNYENTEDTFVDNLRIGSSWLSVTGIPGDLDGDGDIDNADIGMVAGNFTGSGATGMTYEMGDTDGDGDVDNADLGLVAGSFTGALAAPQTAVVPEPASLALLGFGGLLTLRRRSS